VIRFRAEYRDFIERRAPARELVETPRRVA
jgi:hypothetical protein